MIVMEIDPKQLSKWLKTNGIINRTQLCAELGVSLKTSYQWTSGSTPIPISHQTKIISWMQGKPLEQKKILTDSFSITIDEHRYRAYENAAKAEGMGLKEWLISVIDEAAELDGALPNPYSDSTTDLQKRGTAKQEIAAPGLPSLAESLDPTAQKRTTEETLGILRTGANPRAKRKSGSA